jgi:hypothetical protein
MSEPWDTCGKWPGEHDPDCAWYIAANTPEAKERMRAEWDAHPHRLMSNPNRAREAEKVCPTCHPALRT